ncbi:MAG TPA: MASE1 domain-containing protein, partial [Longimicrobiales bacterium]
MLLSLAYYLGARIGFVMQSPEVPQSILWLPNSLLLCALLVAPAAHWPWYLLAAFPAQLAVAAHVQAPILPLTLLFATNCLDAVLGATLVRHFVSSRLKLGRLRHMIVFLAFGATIPTVLVSFADAGLTILTGWGDNYWLAWSTRARANVLTNVLLVPTILGLYHDLRPGWHSFSRRTLVEAVALLVATGGVSYGIFADLEQQWCMYILLPLFLIGAARFGVGVIATQLFILAMMGSWHFLQSNSVFARYFGAADVFPIQLFLFALSVPLLCLASLVEERRATVTALRASARRVRRQFARLSTVYRSTPVGLAFVDCDLRVISANQRIIALSGGTFPVPAARTITECLPSVAGHIEPLVRGVCATGTPIVDSDIVVAHGGRIKHYVVTCDPVRSAADETIGVNIVMQDVTVRIRTQQALLKSREKLRESYVHRMELAGR